MKFNKEEISLCKRVAERHRKDIKYGDWYLADTAVHLNNNFLVGTINVGKQIILHFTPLWTISDCLEFLMDKGYFRIDIVFLEGRFVLWLVHKNEDKRYEPDGDTILEACLKAVLVVLEEVK